MARDGTYKPAGASIVTIPVSPELHRRLRIYCASEGRTVKWAGIKAITEFLDREEAERSNVARNKEGN